MNYTTIYNFYASNVIAAKKLLLCINYACYYAQENAGKTHPFLHRKILKSGMLKFLHHRKLLYTPDFFLQVIEYNYDTSKSYFINKKTLIGQKPFHSKTNLFPIDSN